ncbi:ISAs1 family transposase [Verminephrobacter eiseniae]|uniref:ISAs1 family transposase n=1 Tax=Verminephrobacter eiseniae TaxID=364317 RepID=UPI002AA2ACE8|nr:ISAs1 family transposase [Verminephrobacter eiseniae]
MAASLSETAQRHSRARHHPSGITSVACIDSSRVIGSKTETDRRYVISSLPADSERILHAVRMHWGIENGLHWCLDVTFGEDACPIRLRNAALDFSLPRRVAMNLFRADHSRAMRLPKKRKAAAWSPDYLANILHLREI